MPISLRRAVAALSLALLSAWAYADPSSRVGRLSAIEGQVSFRSSSQAGAEAANLNWPVTSMNQVSTGRNGRVELRVGSSIVQLNGDSELEIIALDDDAFRLRLHYGSLYLNVKNPEVAREVSISTAHGSLRLGQPSRLRLDTEVMPDVTAVAVVSGAALFDSAGANLRIAAGKRMEINDNGTRQVAARFDGFDDWSAARERVIAGDGRAESGRYVSAETTGHEELDRYGDWRVVDEFGPVWTPRNVASDWAPYRDGRWTWIEPWGWTWVDNAPWAYAPSHYGRWVWLDLRWYWVPGRIAARPVWAPAMVGWVGGTNWSLSVNGRSGPGVGWFPLAPREVYVPAYRVSTTYVERINHSYGASMSPPQQYRYARTALTVVPQAQFGARSNVVVTGSSHGNMQHEQVQRLPSDMPVNGRSNPPQDSRGWSRAQERPVTPALSAPPMRGQQPMQVQQQAPAQLQQQPASQPQPQAPAQLQAQPASQPQALPSSRTQHLFPANQHAYPQPAQQVTPPMQPAPQPPPQAAPQAMQPSRGQQGNPLMQQEMPQRQQEMPRRQQEMPQQAQERARSQPSPAAPQMPQQMPQSQPQPQSVQQSVPQQGAPQGSSRERERERAAARQEKRQAGDQPGNH